MLVLPDTKPVLKSGFTLIEMSIVLVIIGLIVGGILTGRDLIDAASQRAQIAQIDKYNTAVNTFRSKYGNLPGDIPNPNASNFGFQSRGQYTGEGDGNGILAGVYANSAGRDDGNIEATGELAVIWVDLSTAGLIDGGFNTATPFTIPGADITGAAIGNYLPQAKIGNGNYVYAWSAGTYPTGGPWIYSGIHYFSISVVSNIAAASNHGKVASTPGLSVQQAYNIDKKIDDGLPQSGNIIAVYLYGVNGDPEWIDGTDTLKNPPSTAATAGASTTCYDNGNVNGAVQKYSVAQNNGFGINCALSFKFQ